MTDKEHINRRKEELIKGIESAFNALTEIPAEECQSIIREIEMLREDKIRRTRLTQIETQAAAEAFKIAVKKAVEECSLLLDKYSSDHSWTDNDNYRIDFHPVKNSLGKDESYCLYIKAENTYGYDERTKHNTVTFKALKFRAPGLTLDFADSLSQAIRKSLISLYGIKPLNS
jgi:hypothetical protein